MAGAMSAIRADAERYLGPRASRWTSVVKLAIWDAGFFSCVIFRAQAFSFQHGRLATATILRRLNLLITGADFVSGCDIGPGLLIRHPVGIVVGAGAVVGSHCTMLQQVTLGEADVSGRDPGHYPVVGDDVILGTGAKILGGIRIGDGAVVGANAVVTKDVGDFHVVVGVPAKSIGTASR
jgi:serine O-acetyltransferase